MAKDQDISLRLLLAVLRATAFAQRAGLAALGGSVAGGGRRGPRPGYTTRQRDRCGDPHGAAQWTVTRSAAGACPASAAQ
ncbi:hypothetical protein [Streptomyces sp. CAS3]